MINEVTFCLVIRILIIQFKNIVMKHLNLN
jgi:hypothetical protein